MDSVPTWFLSLWLFSFEREKILLWRSGWPGIQHGAHDGVKVRATRWPQPPNYFLALWIKQIEWVIFKKQESLAEWWGKDWGQRRGERTVGALGQLVTVPAAKPGGLGSRELIPATGPLTFTYRAVGARSHAHKGTVTASSKNTELCWWNAVCTFSQILSFVHSQTESH